MPFSEIRFQLPPGVLDITPYRFISDKETLAVSRDRLPDGVIELDQLVRYRLDALEGFAPGGVQVKEDELIPMGTVYARRLIVNLIVDEAAISTHVILAAFPDGTYLQIAYRVSPTDSGASARLIQIMRSLRPAQYPPADVPVGFTKRTIAFGTVAVPFELRPPNQWIFQLPRDAGVLDMTVRRAGSSNELPTLAALLAEDSALANSVEGSRSETIRGQHTEIQVLRYILVEQALDQSNRVVITRCRVQFPSGSVALVYSRCHAQLQAITESSLLQLANTLVEDV